MAITHLASDSLLLDYATGRLSPAPALVVATHLAMAEESAGRLSELEAVGGALLDEVGMADVTPDLFERMLARLEEAAPAPQQPMPQDHSGLDMGVDLPRPLAERRIGRWRAIAPGVRFATVDVSEDPAYKVVLLRVGPNRGLPQHGHDGDELTLILKGHFSDESGTYGPGDIQEEDNDSSHQPMVGPEGECICITAIEGHLVPESWIARILMRVYGF
jgi:putative transcriptional regulator